ncbi:SMEK domain-containing protein [Mucilaginibacter flavus]|uniref:SMEK domain-containing protein n=1 Tax=Mucilaginibacter flavus TaxID=931504 RepID=UPI0025B51EF6|nr:SMEK domain-containing protein [Mucilaginibacter flavus]MDN3582107.1 SMEK domain-containing protein [Mucilaginibacter flavus]
MLTRGHIIGKIVDDIAGLKYQVQTRNKVNIYELNTYVESFFRETLNTVYGLSLVNLNADRSNNPGLDLGDAAAQIAFQITSTTTTAKVNETLDVLSAAQLTTYPKIKVFMVGTKQGSYTINPNLVTKTGFNENQDIIDLDDLLKDIMVLPIEALDVLFKQFQREFRKLKMEFETVDTEGNYESSLYNRIEKQPNLPPKNAKKLKDFIGDEIKIKHILKNYRLLAELPRFSRELIAIIGDFGKFEKYGYLREDWGILPQILERKLMMSRKELEDELLILIDAGLIYFGEKDIEEKPHPVVALKGEILNGIVSWANEEKHPLKTLLNTLNFTVLDK